MSVLLNLFLVMIKTILLRQRLENIIEKVD